MKCEKAIDLGCSGWRVMAAGKSSGFIYSSEDKARAAAGPADVIEFFDTRPTIGDVWGKINAAEKNVWDEGMSICWWQKSGLKQVIKFPESWRWLAVYVVPGGSEGLWLHVDIVGRDGDTRELLFLGKTLDTSTEKWFQCYESAARISLMLNA